MDWKILINLTLAAILNCHSDDDPICRSNRELDKVIGQNTCNVEPDKVKLECSVTYHGNIPPQMEWKKAGEMSSTPLEVSVITSENHFVSTLKLRGDIALNNSSYVCETKRTTQEPNKCTSQAIKILYALSDNSTVNKTIGDEIHCSLNTSLSCNYKWKWLQDNDFTIESSTSVLKARKPGWHRCEAECYLMNKTCNILAMRTMIYGDTESSQTRTIIISVVVAVVVTLIVVVALICAFFIYINKTTDETRTQVGEDRVPLNELTKESLPEICGIAILDQEVFISRRQSPNIEVYDSKAFVFKRQMKVKGMTDPEHIVSCSDNNSYCLYAFDWKYQGQPAVLRIDPSNGNLTKFWIVPKGGGRLSIASDTNVILIIDSEAKLHEYTAEGEFIREINLRSERTGIIQAQHAVKLNSGLFVVCHSEYDDCPGRVCLISIKENTSTVKKTYEIKIPSKCNEKHRESLNVSLRPMHLSVNKEGLILVSDESSKQAVLLNSDLNEVQILVSQEHKLGLPWRTCFGESTDQWIVADHHRVMVYKVKDAEVERKLYNLVSH